MATTGCEIDDNLSPPAPPSDPPRIVEPPSHEVGEDPSLMLYETPVPREFTPSIPDFVEVFEDPEPVESILNPIEPPREDPVVD